MIRLIVVILIAAAAIPLLIEQTPSPCDALERRLVNMAARESGDGVVAALIGSAAQGVTNGELASIAVRQEYPNLPAPVACYVVYYRAYYRSIVGA